MSDWSVFQSGRPHRHRLQRPLVTLVANFQLRPIKFRLLHDADDAGDRLVRVPIGQNSSSSSSAASSYPTCKVSAPTSQVPASERSKAVPHRSTNLAQRCLAWQIGRAGAHATRQGFWSILLLLMFPVAVLSKSLKYRCCTHSLSMSGAESFKMSPHASL